MFQFGDDFAAFFAGIKLEIHLTLPVAALGALAAQFFQTAHAAFVAGAARFNAFAYPHFFLRVEFVKQAVVFGFHRQLFGFFLAVAGEATGVRAQYAAVEFNDAVGDVVEKTAVVGNHHDAAVELLQQAFQP